MRITNDIREAFQRAFDHQGYTEKSFADSVGVDQSSVNRWMKGTTKRISPANWRRVEPILKPYMTDSGPSLVKEDPPHYRDSPRPQQLAGSATERVNLTRGVPMLRIDQLTTYDRDFNVWDDWITENATETELFTAAEPGWFALRIVDDSMAGLFPAGSILLVARNETPQPGEVVCAKLTTPNQVAVMEYGMRGNVHTLTDVTDPCIVIDRNGANATRHIAWVWPIRGTHTTATHIVDMYRRTKSRH